MEYPHDSINKLLDYKVVNKLQCVRYGGDIFFVSTTFFDKYIKNPKQGSFPLELASVRITDIVNDMLFEYKLRPSQESKTLMKQYCVEKLMSDIYVVGKGEFNPNSLLSPLQNILSFLRIRQ
jgi:hypothetical protein